MSAIITFLIERFLNAAKEIVDKSGKLAVAISQGEIDKYLEGGLLGWMLLYGLFPIELPSSKISEESGRIDYWKEVYEETGSEEAYEEATRPRIWLYTYANVSRYVIMNPLLVFDRYSAKQIPRILSLKPESIILVETILPKIRPLLKSYNIDYVYAIDTLKIYTPTLNVITLSDSLISQDALSALIRSRVIKTISDVSSISDVLQTIQKSRIIISKPFTLALDELIQTIIRTRQISSIQDIISVLDQYSSISSLLSTSSLLESITSTDALTPIQKSRISKIDSETLSLEETIITTPYTRILVQLTESISTLEISLSGRPWEEDTTKTLLTYRLAEVIKDFELMSYETTVILPFGSVIREASSPNIAPCGIGGNSGVIWHCDSRAERVYELSTLDFSVIRSRSSPTAYPSGIGGDSEVIWHCESYVGTICRINPSDFSSASVSFSPSTLPSGIGGDSEVIWHCDRDANKVYELSTSDAHVIRSRSSPSTNPTGIGGNSEVIWHCDRDADRIYELSTSDFSVIRKVSSPSSTPNGIGGKSEVIWHCDLSSKKIYELSTG